MNIEALKPIRERIISLVKVIRHGQFTLPRELRLALGAEEGDLLELKLAMDAITIKPKVAVDKTFVMEKLVHSIRKPQSKPREADLDELDATLQEALPAGKMAEAWKTKTAYTQS